MAMDKRFKRDHNFHQAYTQFIKEYLELGHMQPIQLSNEQLHQQYILPHHGVIKESSSTTKLRVVFDASAKSTSGFSLNDNLMVGPTIQPSLLELIIRFRQYKHVLIGDIEKMYRQVWVDKDDTKHQIILWKDKNQTICPYALKTITYGTSSASFMATRCLKELALLHKQEMPEASRAIEHDVYVDDLMTGAGTIAELSKLKVQIVQILQGGGFNLRKIYSNAQTMVDQFTAEDPYIKKFAENHEPIKLLGIGWKALVDMFVFHVQIPETKKHTKRTLLSETSKIFDPLGLLAPIIIRIKILFQNLWLQKINWDDDLPVAILTSWNKIRNDIRTSSEIQIPRQICNGTNITIHGFCDASKWAYAAVLYARSPSDHGYITRLICAKTKVAPIKTISLPRLELMGAVLLAKLTKTIISMLTIKVTSITLWTDSKIVLDWLSSQPRKWTTFVANRTSEIISNYKRDKWRHVPTKCNPADCATRGLSAKELANNQLWWNGPTWLVEEEDNWPNQPNIPQTPEESTAEIMVNHLTTGHIRDEEDIINNIVNKFASHQKMLNVLAFVIRFCNNLCKGRARLNGTLKVNEIEKANELICKSVQMKYFTEEYKCLLKGKPIPSTSKLKTLNPFIDESKLMRVGGRIQKSLLPFDTKHPIIISHRSVVATAITYDLHHQHPHPGINLLTSLVRAKFWIVRGKDVAKKVYQRCTKCLRQNPRMGRQIMGQLPEGRVQHTFPFDTVGVDFCGPIKAHPIRKRGSIPVKAYLCVFVCFSTHAIHIEVCMNLSTDSFLGALKRFTSRRGLCHTIYCDNGTNFVGARNHLKEVYEFLTKHYNEISSNLLKHKIEWRFIPPGAPHQGGLWESAVKSTKTHLFRTIGEVILTLEELTTLITQIEGLLNSRPIGSSTNNDEIDPLTPAHFLIGRPMYQVPEQVLLKPPSVNARWDIVKRMYQQFWKRWKLEYVTSLQRRSKWTKPQPNFQLNDIVIVGDNNLPSTQWLLGKIIQLYPGDDGRVRVVQIKTKNGNIKRPIQKLCRLPIVKSDDSRPGECPNSHQPVKPES